MIGVHSQAYAKVKPDQFVVFVNHPLHCYPIIPSHHVFVFLTNNYIEGGGVVILISFDILPQLVST